MEYLAVVAAQWQNTHLCTLRALVRVQSEREKQMLKRVIDKFTQQIVAQTNVLAPKQFFYNCDCQMLSQHH
jgi:hypothetical protein